MNLGNIIYELEDSVADMHDLLEEARAGTLSEIDYETRLRHILKHIFRGYNRRNLPPGKNWKASNEQEYQKLCSPPQSLLKDLA